MDGLAFMRVTHYSSIIAKLQLHYANRPSLSFLSPFRPTGLAPNGTMVVKENVSKSLEFDDLDSSFTRPLSLLKDLIHRSGFRILKDEKQKKFPKDLFEVRMLALQ